MSKAQQLRRYGPYAIAVLGTALVAGFRFSIAGQVGEQAAFIFFGVPIAAAALTGGFLPGLLALSLGILCGTFFFVQPSSRVLSPVNITSFIATWMLVAVICEIAIRRRESERRSNLQKLETEERLSEVLNRISDGFFMIDKHWQIQMVNPAALRLIEREESEVVGRPIWEVFSAHLQPSVRKLMERSFTTSLPVTIDLPASADSQWYQFRVFASPDLERIPVFIQDITAQHELERTRERALAHERAKRSDAEQRNRSKDDFVAMLSHELRTPMTAILGWTEILCSASDPQPFLGEGLTAIDRAAKVQAQLIDDLLDMSRIVTGNLALHKEIVDLGEQLQAVVREQAPTAMLNERTLSCDACDQGVLVRADAGRLHQVISNLVTNGLKFTNEGGHVSLGCKREGRIAVITVTDDGQGIEPEVLPVIFNRFRQGHPTISRRHGGLGLGLAIVRQLVEAHGGTVTAQSDGKGKGATFTVRLPIAEVSSPKGQVQNGTPRSMAGMRVLVVEDDEATRRVVEKLLSIHGATVTATGSGQAGLQLLESTKPSVVLSDLGMPEMDGFTFIQRLRAHDDPAVAKVPAIALTAFTGHEDRDRAILSGFDSFLAKPVDTNQLISTIMEIAERPQKGPSESS
ncbi:MAG: Sensor histidine kinase RcsC [Fimbriimonadaceae bacterium]|nr:Sensor histidine kinase RcsC [Fimbriimonadaceae bacterium]